MNARSFWLREIEMNIPHLSSRSHKANLLDRCATFDFEIKSMEFSSLILRRISICGQCSNSFLLQDAYIGLLFTTRRRLRHPGQWPP